MGQTTLWKHYKKTHKNKSGSLLQTILEPQQYLVIMASIFAVKATEPLKKFAKIKVLDVTAFNFDTRLKMDV